MRDINPNPDPLLFSLKIGTSDIPATENVHTIFGFSTYFFFVSELGFRSPCGTDGQAGPVLRPIVCVSKSERGDRG